MNKIYLDNASTTPLSGEVLNEMMPYLTSDFGNPNSLHSFGRTAKSAVDLARERIAKSIGCEPNEVYFTSGATESNNWALNGIAKTQVQSHAFNIGSVQWLNVSGNDSIEKNIAGEKMYKWTGNVGLINVSDLLKASTNTACKSATDQYNKLMQDTPEITCDSNYLLDVLPDTTGYWTINAFSVESEDGSYGVWIVDRAPGLAGLIGGDAYYDTHCGAHPVLYLKSDIELTSGTGTKLDPYIIN